MITSKITRRIEHPSEEGVWFEIRVLSGEQVREARKAREASEMEGAFLQLRKLRGMKEFEDLRDLFGREAKPAPEPEATDDPTPTEAVEVAPPDPLLLYDRTTLNVCGIVGWSYYKGRPTEEDIRDLDDETADWAAREIAPRPRTEAERGEGSGSSTRR